jgi:hypothetical protein
MTAFSMVFDAYGFTITTLVAHKTLNSEQQVLLLLIHETQAFLSLPTDIQRERP